MTKEELYKEAEEWTISHVCKDCSRYEECKSKERCTCKECSKEKWQNGAWFGYNKFREELNQTGLALQSDMDKTIKQNIALKKELNKANEWHFVSKEGFPNKDDIYLIIRSDGLHLGDYCCGGDGDIDCQSWCDYPSEEEIQDDSVIAWKEIVLPKESL